MRLKLYGKTMAVLAGLSMSSIALAAEGESNMSGLIAIRAGIAVGLAAFGAAMAQGRAAAAALGGIARNPSARGEVFGALVLSLAFMEVPAFLGFVIAFMLKG